MDTSDQERAIAEERRRLRVLRMMVDLTCNLLIQESMTRRQAEALVADTRCRALEIFPDKGETFDLILAPRFARLMNEFVGPAPRTRVLPFRKPMS